ncbi:MAG TPA: hypothetical protein VFM70_01140 [Salinimicrobium sp.]|nr:hypothetical protein [Salinimicrobium sp.]
MSSPKPYLQLFLNEWFYNEEFEIFIDTTNVIVTESDTEKSITMSILKDQDLTKVENLVLVLMDDGSYKAFITEYSLSTEDLEILASGGNIANAIPTLITEIDSGSKIHVSGECSVTVNYTVRSCKDEDGNWQADNGQSGNGCASNFGALVTYQIVTIDMYCMAQGGGSSDIPVGDPDGSGNTGYDSDTPGGSSSTNNNSIYDSIIDMLFNTTFVPCTECVELTPELSSFMSSLSQDLLDYWSSLTFRSKTQYIDYMIQNNYSTEAQEEVVTILDILDDGMVNGEYVVVGPDVPIEDMAEYLSCFNPSQPAMLTIYADQPVANSHWLYSSEDRVGHAFFSIEQGSNIATLGFYPQSTLGAINQLPVYGAYGNDENHDYDVSISIPINASTLSQIIETLTSNASPMYHLNINNCTDVALLIGNLTQVEFPSCKSPYVFWQGNTPGTLRETIRTMPIPNGGSNNLSGGNAESNNCN